jgi:hypothetical protein
LVRKSNAICSGFRAHVLVAGLPLQSLNGESAAHFASGRVERGDDALCRESCDLCSPGRVQVRLSVDRAMVGESIADDGTNGVDRRCSACGLRGVEDSSSIDGRKLIPGTTTATKKGSHGGRARARSCTRRGLGRLVEKSSEHRTDRGTDAGKERSASDAAEGREETIAELVVEQLVESVAASRDRASCEPTSVAGDAHTVA